MASDAEGEVDTEEAIVEVPSLIHEPLQAVIRGIQFGLFSNADTVKLSVCDNDNPIKVFRKLADPRLGLPTSSGICATCNGGRTDMCQGHFGHCVLPQLIFHPNHFAKLVAVLRKICLKCGQLKRKKKSKAQRGVTVSSPKSPTNQSTQTSADHRNENGASTSRGPHLSPQSPVIEIVEDYDDNQLNYAAIHKRKFADIYVDKEARVAQGVPISSGEDAVILLSSDDDAALSDGGAGDDDEAEIRQSSPPIFGKRNVGGKRTLVDEEDDLAIGQSSAAVLPRRSGRKRKSHLPTDPSSVPIVVDLTNCNESHPFSRDHTHEGEKRQRLEKGNSENNSGATPTAIPVKSTAAPRNCKYCRGNSARYPEISLKVENSERGNGDALFKMLKMVINVKKNDTSEVAPDFWNFVAPKGHSSSGIPRPDRLLLPTEALEILRRIPKSDAARLGMHPDVASPESLIIENIPVPPNCTRILDEAFGVTNLGLKLGVDRATLAFGKMLNRIATITKTRLSLPTFSTAIWEAAELQTLFGMYLREKGAPKSVPGTEKKKIDHVGRVEKRDSRWSLDWLKRHVLGKRGAYSARNVLTGDPYLKVEEIGIPRFVAKHVTIPERVNKLNKEWLQECVENGKNLVGRYRACGAVRIIKNGEGFEVTKKSEHMVEIGDIVHRHLKDGDLVYVNRPPSLHKHSLLGLKVYISDMPVFTINPAVCAPLHADFDGDCLHLFAPQSEEVRAELKELMTLPAQILPSHVGRTIMGLSQDSILATYLMTASPVFLAKAAAQQLSMWTSRDLPIPTIVKSPMGPRWTGKQVFDLTLPKKFSVKTSDGAVQIAGGELISYGSKKNWITSTEGLVCKLAQHNSQAAVDHLDSSQSIMREWLLSRGFSLSLADFYVALDSESRTRMIQNLRMEIRKVEELAITKELLFDQEYQKMDIHLDSFERQSTGALEEISINFFQDCFREIGVELGSAASSYNQLLAMVHAGSKGSLPKVLQQIGCFGLQLQKGERLVYCKGNSKLMSLAQSMLCDDTWECQGLVKNSLLDGLEPLEYFLHSVAVRAALLRQSLEVTEPGELFKNLMLFLRDVHVAYDGTVRSKCGAEIIQFSYESGEDPDSVIDFSRWSEVVMPGEPVGILAATAIAQPAYQIMLEASHNVGSQKIRPLELLQSTIFPRKETKLKTGDRRSILRLKPCMCPLRHCDEIRALDIVKNLTPVRIETVATALAIQYIGEDSVDWMEYEEEEIKLDLPWIGHVRFDQDWMAQNEVGVEQVEEAVRIAFSQKRLLRALWSNQLKKPIFFSRENCECMGGGPCLHFSASVKSRSRTKKGARRTHEKTFDFVSALRDGMMPLILSTCIKGDERVESVKITWEEAVWSPGLSSEDGEIRQASGDGELVLDIQIEGKESMARGSPWCTLKEICLNVEGIDWNRSAPYSVQEIQHALGVEAARGVILQRLTLATRAGGASVQSNHLKLVADLMVRSGEVIGLTSSGYKDLMKSLKTSAPFTSGAFRAPIKTFMSAGEKGEAEPLDGVLATNMFGKRVPVGTGGEFCLKLEPKNFPRCTMEVKESVDIFELLGDLRSKINAEFPEAEAEERVVHDYGQGMANVPADEGGDWTANQNNGEDWEATGDAGWNSHENDGDWGAKGNGGGWGADSGTDGAEALDEWNKNSEPTKPSSELGTTSSQWGQAEGGDGDEMELERSNEIMNLEDQRIQSPAKEVADGAWGGLPLQDEGTAVWGSSPPGDSEVGGWGMEVQGNETIDGLNVRGRARPESISDRGDNDLQLQREPRQFRPSGANMIPLGKVRQFKLQSQDEGTGGASLQSPSSERTSLDMGLPADAEAVNGSDGDTWGAEPCLATSQEDNLRWESHNVASDWSAIPMQEGGSESRWEDKGDDSAKDSVAYRAPASIRRALDSRKDSKAWDDVVEKVRVIKNILQTRMPGEDLEDSAEIDLVSETLLHHPSHAMKVGCGIKYIKVGHVIKGADIKPTKCFFLVRNDNTQDDFSYHKCLHNMTKNMDPPLDDLYEIAFMRRRVGDFVASSSGPRGGAFP